MKHLSIKKKILVAVFGFITLTSFSIIFYLFYSEMKNEYKNMNNALVGIQEKQALFESIVDTVLYEDHLRISQNIMLDSQIESLNSDIGELLAKDDNENYAKILEIQELYGDFSKKVDRNKNVSIEVSDVTDDISSWGNKLLDETYDDVLDEIKARNDELDKDYDEYIASLPPPPAPAQVSEGYSYQTVSTERGTFGVYLIKVPLSSVKVVTASASGDDCKDNCPTKSLAQHVQDNGGYAGINGAYFCPPDYSSCGGKINSSDYAFYKSSSGKWLNDDALSWGDTGLATFRGNSAKFYKKSSDYSGDSVTAGISNYPTLLDNGEIVVKDDKLTSYQRDIRGSRGAIGIGKENLYLAIITGATVKDAAYAMRSLGALDALNLDGGGSSALYINDRYVVGPGRSLPNAVVLVK